jgi:hypothetical protein
MPKSVAKALRKCLSITAGTTTASDGFVGPEAKRGVRSIRFRVPEVIQPNVVRFCGGARRGPRVPQGIYRARAEVYGPDRSKRGLGGLPV